MSTFSHPPPPSVHGLLSIKRGGQFSKRIRRLARLENAFLELRLRENDPVEWSTSLIDTKVHANPTNLCITVSAKSYRIKLYPHSHEKYKKWLSACRQSSVWNINNYYQVFPDQLLGEGQFSVVNRALHRQTRAVVAVKCIRTNLNGAPTSHPYLSNIVARECRICRLVSHHAIINVRDIFEVPGTVYIVMELIPHTLHDVIRMQTIIPESQAATITQQLLQAIAYLHEKNIVHRDIKPDNVLCADTSGNMTIKICDFGMSNFLRKRVDMPLLDAHSGLIPKRLQDLERKTMNGNANALGPFSRPVHLSNLSGLEQNGLFGRQSRVLQERGCEHTNRFWSAIDGLTLTSAIGAPSYVAPELVKGQRYGKPVDVWGVGVLLFYMLAGYLPFEGNNACDVLQKILVCEPDFDAGPWSRVSPNARRFVQSLMHPDPRKRITAESALEHEWLVQNCQ